MHERREREKGGKKKKGLNYFVVDDLVELIFSAKFLLKFYSRIALREKKFNLF